MAAKLPSLQFFSYDLTLITDYIEVLKEFIEFIAPDSSSKYYPVYKRSVAFIIQGLKIHFNYQEQNLPSQIYEVRKASSSLDSMIINLGEIGIDFVRLDYQEKKDINSSLYTIRIFVEDTYIKTLEAYRHENIVSQFFKINSSEDIEKIGKLLDSIISEINQSSIIKPEIKKNIIDNLEKAKKELLIDKNFLSFHGIFRKAMVVCRNVGLIAGGLATAASISGYNMRNINELPTDIDQHLFQALIKMEEVEEELESCIEINEQYAFTEAYLIQENKRLKGKIEKLGALPQTKESKVLPGDVPKDIGNAELLENDTD